MKHTELTTAVVRHAAAKLGLITRPGLHRLGASKDQIYRMRKSGLIVPLGRRTFALAGVPASFERDVMAACLDTGGVASHRSAARLHGLKPDLYRGSPIEVCVPEGTRAHPSPLANIHTSTSLAADDLVHVGPIPAVGAARTFLMLCALVPEISADDIRTAIGDACRESLVSDAWLWWRLEQLRCRGRNGVTVLEHILIRRQSLGPTESWLEHTFADLLVAEGLPLPEVQQRIAPAGRFLARVDFLYRQHRLVIELEGLASHSTAESRRNDEVRRRRLVLAGFQVMVITSEEIAHGGLAAIADVRAALTRSSAA